MGEAVMYSLFGGLDICGNHNILHTPFSNSHIPVGFY